jgi:hypothetical protein
MMQPSQGSSFPRRAFACLPYVSLLGLGVLVVNVALSFEEPHWPMLTVAALLLVATPLGILLHMAITSEMTPAEKRMWFSALAGRRGPSLFAAYFSATDRARATGALRTIGGDRASELPDRARRDGRAPTRRA